MIGVSFEIHLPEHSRIFHHFWSFYDHFQFQFKLTKRLKIYNLMIRSILTVWVNFGHFLNIMIKNDRHMNVYELPNQVIFEQKRSKSLNFRIRSTYFDVTLWNLNDPDGNLINFFWLKSIFSRRVRRVKYFLSCRKRWVVLAKTKRILPGDRLIDFLLF